jgi:AcrR family transcriptional regulator
MPDEPREPVMRATYRALCAHGYANLTMQDIADETDLSKAALHYHYDTKRDLLTTFLDALASWYEGRLDDLAGDTAAERLRALFDECLSCEDSDYPAFHTAMLEVKAQAPYEERYRTRLATVDEVLTARIRTIVAEGVDDGTFRDVDPTATAELLVDVLAGAHTRNVAVGRNLAGTRARLDDYVEDQLLAHDADDGPEHDAAGDGEHDADADVDSDQEHGGSADRDGTSVDRPAEASR